jgi:thiamine transporter ThiT
MQLFIEYIISYITIALGKLFGKEKHKHSE